MDYSFSLSELILVRIKKHLIISIIFFILLFLFTINFIFIELSPDPTNILMGIGKTSIWLEFFVAFALLWFFFTWLSGKIKRRNKTKKYQIDEIDKIGDFYFFSGWLTIFNVIYLFIFGGYMATGTVNFIPSIKLMLFTLIHPSLWFSITWWFWEILYDIAIVPQFTIPLFALAYLPDLWNKKELSKGKRFLYSVLLLIGLTIVIILFKIFSIYIREHLLIFAENKNLTIF